MLVAWIGFKLETFGLDSDPKHQQIDHLVFSENYYFLQNRTYRRQSALADPYNLENTPETLFCKAVNKSCVSKKYSYGLSACVFDQVAVQKLWIKS